jgi:hypothetical protein
VEQVRRVKARMDEFDAIHLSRSTNPSSTLCGLRVDRVVNAAESDCPRCRDFEAGRF